jgi:hypothetical protein
MGKNGFPLKNCGNDMEAIEHSVMKSQNSACENENED